MKKAKEIERKWLIDPFNKEDLQKLKDASESIFKIKQTYLPSSTSNKLIRVRETQDANHPENISYEMIIKTRSEVQMVNTEEITVLNKKEYETELNKISMKPIVKTRIVVPFYSKDTRLKAEIDIFESIPLFLCEVEFPDESWLNEKLELPSILKIVQEVSVDPQYKNENIFKQIQ